MYQFSTNQRSGLELLNYCPISKIHSYETKKSVQDNYYLTVAYAGFFNGGFSVTSHRDDVSFSDVTAIIMP